MRLEVVDLFCGIGGLSYGFKAEGFNIVGGIDNDETCKYAFEENLNASFIAADIREITQHKVRSLFSNRANTHTILIGCAPCPPFSSYTQRYRKKKKRDDRPSLLQEFSRIIIGAKPDVVSMENVPKVVKHPMFKLFVEDLKKAGYDVSFKKVKAYHYGVPQRRIRLVLLASRFGKIELSDGHYKDNPVTVRETIGHLPKVSAGIASKLDRLHVSRNLTSKNLIRIRSTREGGGWKDWDESLQLDCHKKKKGKSFRSVYGRMNWDQPSPVITTQCLGIGNGRFGHPEQDRAITIREAALLQTFPKKFKLLDPQENVNGVMLARQIGNAVPVKLSRAIAREIKKHLQIFSSDA